MQMQCVRVRVCVAILVAMLTFADLAIIYQGCSISQMSQTVRYGWAY